MSVRKLLGIESCPWDDEEIMRRLQEAHKNHVEVLEFPTKNKTVKIILQGVSPFGIDWREKYC